MNVFDMPFSKVYACLVQKAERKGRTKDALRQCPYLPGGMHEDCVYPFSR